MHRPYTINLQDGSNIGVLAFNNNLTLKTDTLKFDLGSTQPALMKLRLAEHSLSRRTSTINIAALTSDTSLTPGDYTLITATSGLGSGFSLSPSSLTVGGTNYTFSLTDSTATQEVLTVGGVVASNGSDTWSATGSGNWETASKLGERQLCQNGAAQVATFANSIGSTAATVTLTANETVGTVAFSDAAGSYSLNASGASVLTLNNNTSAAAITVATGNQTINAPIALTNGVNVTTANGSGLTIGGAVTGTGTLTTTTGSTVTDSLRGHDRCAFGRQRKFDIPPQGQQRIDGFGADDSFAIDHIWQRRSCNRKQPSHASADQRGQLVHLGFKRRVEWET